MMLAKAVFLFTHGALLCNLGSYLDSSEKTDWLWVFFPAWLGNSLTAVLLVVSWLQCRKRRRSENTRRFASCPYIKLCLNEHLPQVNENPSILTEVFPNICMAVMGLLFVICMIIMEYMLCDFLMYRGTSEEAHYEKALVATSTICCLMCLLHSVCLKRNTPLYAVASATGLSTIVVLECAHLSVSFLSIAIFPLVGGVGAALYFSIRELRSIKDVLCAEERWLRFAECTLIGIELLIIVIIAAGESGLPHPHGGGFPSYRMQGLGLGLPLICISMLRIRMLWYEFYGRVGTIEARLLKKIATQVCAEGQELEASTPDSPLSCDSRV
eukprot:GEMP01062893.1.p1 GENE.GEMP01062893.1~~GEMP01062893.1.p1  ORF type:complete len:358 (-),score=28.91 GEMP01062893.1:304-1284(-)